MYHLSHITINLTLVRKFEKWCKFSSCMKTKSCKNKLCKERPACIMFNILNDSVGCINGCDSSKGYRVNIAIFNNSLAWGLIETCVSHLYFCINMHGPASRSVDKSHTHTHTHTHTAPRISVLSFVFCTTSIWSLSTSYFNWNHPSLFFCNVYCRMQVIQ